MSRKLQPCGTNGGYERHRLHHETACDPCREAHRLYMIEYDAARGRTNHDARPEPRELVPCGTFAAAQRHLRHDEPLCDPCADATRAYKADYARKRRAATVTRRLELDALIGDVFGAVTTNGV